MPRLVCFFWFKFKLDRLVKVFFIKPLKPAASVNNAPASCINANVQDCRMHFLCSAYEVLLGRESLHVTVNVFYFYCYHFASFALYLCCALPAVFYDVWRHVIMCTCISGCSAIASGKRVRAFSGEFMVMVSGTISGYCQRSFCYNVFSG